MSIISAGTSNTSTLVYTGDTTGAMVFQTNGTTEAMRITSGQQVGIGTSSPSGSVKLDVRDNSGFAAIQLAGTGVATAQFTSDGATNVTLKNVSNGGLLFGTNNTERMRINAGAPILCLSGGNTSATGTGIAFPATQSASADANTLDDYEEGTFTPTAYGSSSGGPFTFGTQTGYYTKIGREVKVSMFMSHNSTVSFSGAYVIGNLPFVISGYSGGGFVSYWANWSSNSPKIFQVEASTTSGYLRMFNTSDQANMYDLNSGLIGNNTSYMLTILYQTNT